MSDEENALAALADVSDTVASRLADAGICPADITEGRVSRSDLVAAGVPEGDADRIRRSHRLAWSFRVGDSDLVRRAARVQGLTPEERAWVAAADADWEGAARATTDGLATDLAAVPGISEADADRLAVAGVTSQETLESVDAADIADVLGFDVRHVRTWRTVARERDGF